MARRFFGVGTRFWWFGRDTKRTAAAILGGVQPGKRHPNSPSGYVQRGIVFRWWTESPMVDIHVGFLKGTQLGDGFGLPVYFSHRASRWSWLENSNLWHSNSHVRRED